MSTGDAAVKAGLDNFGAAAVTSFRHSAIDIVAKHSDKILEIVGCLKDNLFRIITGIINKFSPSDVIKQTTDLMIQDSWSDIGNALVWSVRLSRQKE